MNSDDVVSQAEADERILAFDIPDHVLERTASAEYRAFTMFYCTSPSYNCNVPQ
jgi:chemotaxis methyl-accepting protein methylase